MTPPAARRRSTHPAQALARKTIEPFEQGRPLCVTDFCSNRLAGIFSACNSRAHGPGCAVSVRCATFRNFCASPIQGQSAASRLLEALKFKEQPRLLQRKPHRWRELPTCARCQRCASTNEQNSNGGWIVACCPTCSTGACTTDQTQTNAPQRGLAASDDGPRRPTLAKSTNGSVEAHLWLGCLGDAFRMRHLAGGCGGGQ